MWFGNLSMRAMATRSETQSRRPWHRSVITNMLCSVSNCINQFTALRDQGVHYLCSGIYLCFCPQHIYAICRIQQGISDPNPFNDFDWFSGCFGCLFWATTSRNPIPQMKVGGLECDAASARRFASLIDQPMKILSSLIQRWRRDCKATTPHIFETGLLRSCMRARGVCPVISGKKSPRRHVGGSPENPTESFFRRDPNAIAKKHFPLKFTWRFSRRIAKIVFAFWDNYPIVFPKNIVQETLQERYQAFRKKYSLESPSPQTPCQLQSALWIFIWNV